MGNFCTNCGSKIQDYAKFCPNCGNSIIPTFNVADNIEKTEDIASSPNVGLAGITNKVEEIELGRFSPIPAMAEGMVGDDSIRDISNILNPVSTLLRGIKTLCVGFKNVFKNKKNLVMALVLAGIWIVLTVLPMLGITSKLVDAAYWITFARGGLRGGYAGIVGGMIGKGMFATLVCSIFTGNMKGTGNGLKKIVSAIKSGSAGTMLMGIGFALALFNFMAGVSNPINSMAGITGCLLSLRALSSNSFIRKFAISCTSRKSNGKRLENTKSCQSLIAGLTVGFALASAISFIKIDYLPYAIGAFGVVAGIIVSIITSNKRKVAS